jgi:opacity protein-like surface antigen
MKNLVAAAAAAAMAASPCLAADIPAFHETGARQSGAVAAAYVKVPLGGSARTAKAHGGLRLSMTHDYRSAGAQTAPVVSADAFDLRLVGEKKPTVYVAGRKLDENKRSNLGPVGSVLTIAIVAAAVVAGFYLARAIDDSGEE